MPPEPRFLLQVVDGQGVVVQLPAGGSLEADLLETITDAIAARGLGSAELTIGLALQEGVEAVITACVDAIVARGVGIGRTEAHVAQDVRDGLRDVLRVDIFAKRTLAWNSPDARKAIRLGLQDAVLALKARTRDVA